jgi:hypothetical protein
VVSYDDHEEIIVTNILLWVKSHVRPAALFSFKPTENRLVVVLKNQKGDICKEYPFLSLNIHKIIKKKETSCFLSNLKVFERKDRALLPSIICAHGHVYERPGDNGISQTR